MLGDFFTKTITIHLWVYVLALVALGVSIITDIYHFWKIKKSNDSKLGG